MLRQVFVDPLVNGFVVYPDFQTPAGLIGTAFWLCTFGLIGAWMLSALVYHFNFAEEREDGGIGIEAGMRLAWGLSFACLALVAGAYAVVLAGLVGMHELGWGALWLLMPSLVTTVMLLLFSVLTFRTVHRRMLR